MLRFYRGILRSGSLLFLLPLVIDTPSARSFSSSLQLRQVQYRSIPRRLNMLKLSPRSAFCSRVLVVYPHRKTRIGSAKVCGRRWDISNAHLWWMDVCYIDR